MNKFVANTLVAIVFLIAGWFASREYLMYQMVSVFKGAASSIGAVVDNSLPERAKDAEKPTRELSKILISNPRIAESKPSDILPGELMVHIKNGSSRTISGISFEYELITPGRKVAWMKRKVSASIPGGIAPGEEGDAGALELENRTLEKEIKQRPEAELRAHLTEAIDENNNAI